MKNCCFCWQIISGDAAHIQPGLIPASADYEPHFRPHTTAEGEYAHEECFERAKTAFRAAMVAVATMRSGGAR